MMMMMMMMHVYDISHRAPGGLSNPARLTQLINATLNHATGTFSNRSQLGCVKNCALKHHGRRASVSLIVVVFRRQVHKFAAVMVCRLTLLGLFTINVCAFIRGHRHQHVVFIDSSSVNVTVVHQHTHITADYRKARPCHIYTGNYTLARHVMRLQRRSNNAYDVTTDVITSYAK